ncbi:DUF7288 family protein [Halapricum hydrolyticum]|uniref:Uncharacterized protein n=1 Tax=Halapricum hydrolyticum TaxID=2979991 RepID=A0AAE3IAY3_9EURY|nr:hypothetical protein [Halapricum hydrolyticum]MCU4716612.1 hypothetical protein [Halapricum hydrolyticum]MCU4725783.1 hypothetical protein [Halapricum hydrolyticum]
MVNRAQAHTLEAVIAALLLLTSLVFALQITAVTPLSASTSNQHIENQQQASAAGVLSMSLENGELKQSLLYWNASGERFHNGTVNGYYTETMPTAFGRILERSFGNRGIAYNVNLIYATGDGRLQTEELIYRGVPSDNAVVTSRSVVLTDDDRIRYANMTAGDRVSESDFYAPDVGDGGYYNTVRVEVVVWRI